MREAIKNICPFSVNVLKLGLASAIVLYIFSIGLHFFIGRGGLGYIQTMNLIASINETAPAMLAASVAAAVICDLAMRDRKE